MPYEGQTGTAPDGTRVIFRAGKVYPIEQDPQKMSPKATEDQAKANTYARLMRNAEGSYDQAVKQGYNPGGLRNSTASFFEGLPLGGLDGVGALIRDDVSDRARQAELQWSDAQLKAVSGAASPEAEVKRNVRTFFPRPGENMQDINDQKELARRVAFESAQMRAGPFSASIGDYPTAPAKPKARQPGWSQALPKPQLKAAMLFKGSKAPAGSSQNPYVPQNADEFRKLPSGSRYIDDDGSIQVKR